MRRYKDFNEYVDNMIGDYGAELKKKTFNDRRKTTYLEAIKYNADIIWNEYNIKRDDDPTTHTIVKTDVLDVVILSLHPKDRVKMVTTCLPMTRDGQHMSVLLGLGP